MGLPFTYEQYLANPKLGHKILSDAYDAMVATGGTVISGVPTGALIYKASAAAPTGYLLCDGSAVSRTTYADLFADIGTTWGAGNGTTTFNLPDFRDRFPVGAGSTYALAASGGATAHTLTTAEMPSHTHSTPAHAHVLGASKFTTAGSHTHGGVGGGIAENSNPTDGASSSPASSNTDGSGTSGSAGSGTPHSILPPYLAVFVFIHI